jgi:hypothetical protein
MKGKEVLIYENLLGLQPILVKENPGWSGVLVSI